MTKSKNNKVDVNRDHCYGSRQPGESEHACGNMQIDMKSLEEDLALQEVIRLFQAISVHGNWIYL